MNEIIYEVQSKIKSSIFLDFDMGKSTWFRVGGKARGYVVVNSIKDLKTILSYANHINYYIIGVGSNLLVRDSGFNGLIIKLGRNFNRIKISKNRLSAGAGVLDINLAKFADFCTFYLVNLQVRLSPVVTDRAGSMNLILRIFQVHRTDSICNN